MERGITCLLSTDYHGTWYNVLEENSEPNNERKEIELEKWERGWEERKRARKNSIHDIHMITSGDQRLKNFKLKTEDCLKESGVLIHKGT